jgi:hypothetical protein
MSETVGAQSRAEIARRRRERQSAPRRRTLRAARLNDSQVEVSAEIEVVTTDTEADARMLAAKVAPSYARLLAFYRDFGGEDAAELAQGRADDQRARLAERARESPAAMLTWNQIGALSEIDLAAGLNAWLRVKDFAHDELESGQRAANFDTNLSPLECARYLAVRDSFIDQWKPDGGIDMALIEMLAQNYSLYLYWTFISHSRATGMCDNAIEMSERTGGYPKKWQMPYQMTQDSIEEAHRMAERYNRIFLRTLRQMRDLRRYAPPVIVNNGGQVNVANQQFNAKA